MAGMLRRCLIQLLLINQFMTSSVSAEPGYDERLLPDMVEVSLVGEGDAGSATPGSEEQSGRERSRQRLL
ncbi:MAG TPA: hypothetical protein VLL73_06240, partial [Desulfurivibrionaceae bacterium]|nr:hypothetical protein [Desulfurivibrionaceae bacterium]